MEVLSMLETLGTPLDSDNANDQRFNEFLYDHPELGAAEPSSEQTPFYLGYEIDTSTSLEPGMWKTATQTLDGRTGQWKYDGDKED